MENAYIKKIINASPKNIDISDGECSRLLLSTATDILNFYKTIDKIEQVERDIISKKELVFILTAIKIAKSKYIINQISKPLKISIVIAMYKEHSRIRTKRENPLGEDFLREKLNQIKWLFDDNSNIKWELILVDDGCPSNSGKIAQNIIDEANLKNVKVIFLQNAIDNKLQILKELNNTDESRKGGAIIYGIWDATQNSKHKNHNIIFTDADMSTNLGQIGLLLDPIINDDKLVSIGSRREKQSILIKKGNRNDRGKIFIYIWKKLIPNLHYIIDSQCGFKAFRRDVLVEIFKSNVVETKFAFDIELLLKAELIRKNCIAKVPIAWIDSDKSSTTTDLDPYLDMLKSISKIYRTTLTANDQSDQFASLVEDMTQEQFDKLLNNIPDEIKQKEPHQIQYDNSISANFLMDIIKK